MTRQEQVQRALNSFPKDGQPCLGCKWSAACADLELACHNFRQWVNASPQTATARHPGKSEFNQLFSGVE